MELALKIGQFILSISILVVLHELGHFLPAKWFKTKIEKFYLFFDPYFSLFSMKKINGKWETKFFTMNQPDTEKIIVDGKEKEVAINLENLPDSDWRKHTESTKWGIGWLPMGGYVKIAGMVDESMDIEQLKKPAEPWEFRSKPAWQRLIIMLGGVIVNFFLGWLIFSGLSYFNGESYTDFRKFDHGLSVTEASKKMGFESGDKILKVDGKPVTRLEESSFDILLSNNVTVERNGQEKTFAVNEDGIRDVIKQKQAGLFLTPRIPMVLDSVGTSATAAGLQKNDKIVAIGENKISFFDEASGYLEKLKGQNINLTIERNGQQQVIENVPINKNGKIGLTTDTSFFRNMGTTENYTFLQSIPRGFERTIGSLTKQVKQFRLIFNSKIKGYESVGGPIAIVNMMPVDKSKSGDFSIDWTKFWSFTAMFSVWLAFLNLLPIPGLDGGHVVFTLWEMITGKPVPQKVLESAQMIGVVFLLGLMLLIFGNDIYKLIMNKF
ncbi:RIP metalloprotease RseP [Frigoriflavimonas asaccharolytica]|uniref:Zinc metalloprotease n=1 Tax=Frigoriflavimonas asaccharolytica TaxID=2735899 RepID=A0A8J8G909_9FLAO|nr:RIP metalloprotease RseP [Frigoriflavimonas asaccharolytica]NRS93338.1 regulator of sigma E protease [Frigoriflavimonas asaccharolytica]